MPHYQSRLQALRIVNRVFPQPAKRGGARPVQGRLGTGDCPCAISRSESGRANSGRKNCSAQSQCGSAIQVILTRCLVSRLAMYFSIFLLLNSQAVERLGYRDAEESVPCAPFALTSSAASAESPAFRGERASHNSAQISCDLDSSCHPPFILKPHAAKPIPHRVTTPSDTECRVARWERLDTDSWWGAEFVLV